MIRSNFAGICGFALALFASSLAATEINDQCPKEPVLLKNPPTPVQDQGQTPWCASFASSSALSYYVRGQDPTLPADLIVSALDLNDRVEGGVLSLKSGAAISSILETVQDQGFSVKTLKGSPFVFNNAADYNKLVESLRKRTQDYAAQNLDYEGQVRLKDHQLKTESFVVKGHATGKASKGKGEVVGIDSDAVVPGSMKRPSFPETYPASIKIPDYDVHTSYFDPKAKDYGEKYFANVIQRIQEDAPVQIGTCARVMVRDLKLSELIESEDKCGAHAMLVVGVKRNAKNECVMIVQNSWGTGWGDKGYVDIPFSKHLVHMKGYSSDSLQTSWIRPAKSPGKRLNTLNLVNGASIVGEIRGGLPAAGPAQVSKYPYPSGAQYSGSVKIVLSPGSRSYTTQPNGTGAFKGPGDLWSEGDFVEGRLVNGRARLNASDGIYEGTVKDGNLQDGVITRPDGGTRRVIKGYSIGF